MVTGIVTAAREATIPLTVYDAAGDGHPLTVVIDTGFNGSLALAPGLVESLGLRWNGRDFATLADGSETVFDFYEAIVSWDGAPRRTVVLAAESNPLAGMALIAGYELTIQAVPGGKVSIVAMQ